MPSEELEFLPTPYAASFGPPQRTDNKRPIDSDTEASNSKRVRSETPNSLDSSSYPNDLQAKHVLPKTLPKPEPDHISGQVVTGGAADTNPSIITSANQVPKDFKEHTNNNLATAGTELVAAYNSSSLQINTSARSATFPPSNEASFSPVEQDLEKIMDLGYTPEARVIIDRAHEAALTLPSIINSEDDELWMHTTKVVFHGLQEIRNRWMDLETERKSIMKISGDGKVFSSRGRSRGRCKGRGRGRGRGRARWKTNT